MEFFTLANIWACLLVLMLGLYVVLDGFDLGIGILSLFTPASKYKNIMMKSIAPVWDANETWLVLAGGTLFGAFPVVYSVVANALYIPITLMIFGFILRAISFEFRGQSRRKYFWEFCFGLGSLLAASGQGFILGGIITGIKTDGSVFTGSAWDWFNLLSILTAVAVIFGYTMIGASYLVAKTQGDIRNCVCKNLTVAAILMFVTITAIAISMPFTSKYFSRAWIYQNSHFVMTMLGLGTVFSVFMIIAGALLKQYRLPAFIISLLIFVIALACLGFGIYPFIVPPSITIASAASSLKTLISMILGIGLLIPLLLFYNIYMYRVFHGVVEETEGY